MSETIHFESNFKGQPGRGLVPKCTQYAMSPKYGSMTKDQAKVSCTRCAKMLGITAAAKNETGSPTGTCQCCFGDFKVPKKDVHLHGYKRPGNGYIVGRCRGEGHLPFEVSCEQTKIWHAELKGLLAKNEADLLALQDGTIKELHTMIRSNETFEITKRGTYGGTYKSKEVVMKAVVVKKGDKEKENPYIKLDAGLYYYPVKSFADLLARRVKETQLTIEQIKGEMTFLAGKITSWVAVPFPKVAK